MFQEILQFMLRHWMLSSMLVVTLILLFWQESRNKVGGLRLSLQDATTLINRKHAVLIDVRDANMFDAGHVASAINFPYADIAQASEKLKKYQHKPIILIDQNGHQAALVMHKLLKQGFKEVYCLAGGLQTWLSAALPLTTRDK